MTRTTPELASPFQTSAPHQREDVWPLRMIYRATGPIRGGSSVESGFEPASLRSRGLPPRKENSISFFEAKCCWLRSELCEYKISNFYIKELRDDSDSDCPDFCP
ncbi:hypothetical protein AVEN_48799-1 [Araneus ventricosus]|uniref:Uncharacterized protein n=1 Tax=Araneus ventricosus TaxID=182803 RepID=A0A4Y2IFY4_ARAVE|nr:hypothetical protein AVEN_48799-1 [Araneus ventricosus]